MIRPPRFAVFHIAQEMIHVRVFTRVLALYEVTKVADVIEVERFIAFTTAKVADAMATGEVIELDLKLEIEISVFLNRANLSEPDLVRRHLDLGVRRNVQGGRLAVGFGRSSRLARVKPK